MFERIKKTIVMTKPNGKKKKLGVVTSDGRFLTFRKEKNKFRMYNGWGFNAGLLNYLLEIGIETIEIITEKRILRTSIQNAIHGIKYRNPKGVQDLQYIVPEQSFLIRDKRVTLVIKDE